MDRNDYSTLHADINKAIKSVSVERKVMYSSNMRQGQGNTVRVQPRVYPFLQKRISKYPVAIASDTIIMGKPTLKKCMNVMG